MQNKTKWMTWMGLGAVVVASAAGCGNKDADDPGGSSDKGVPSGIQSPVMDKGDDKAVTGTSVNTGNAMGNSANGGKMGNSASGGAMSNSANGGKMSGGAMNSKMKGQAVPKPMTGNSAMKKP